ncbi:MAG: peptidylprolyl isomerase [Melioribacteraceae bacterium]|nr:peptidylprolyl isomerase [Melioribacteraceae bacterium]
MNLKLTIILLFGCSAIISQQNSDENVLARVGDKKITVREFKERYELIPQVGRNVKAGEEQQKQQYLYTLIAEKLWALEAEKLSFDTTEIMQTTFPVLEKMYLRDALYKKEVSEKILLDPEEFLEARRRSSYNLLTRYLYSESPDEVYKWYNQLRSGAAFDSLFDKHGKNPGNYYEVGFGKMDKFAEDSLYNLSKGMYSAPIKSPDGYYLFYVDSLTANYYSTENEINTRDSQIRKVVKSRAEDELYAEYFNSFFKGKQINTDGSLFWSFSSIVIDILTKRSEEQNNAGKISIADNDLEIIERRLGADTLNMPFVKYEDNPVSLKEFIRDFFFEGFQTFTTDPQTIRAQLNSRVRYFIERELLARESLKNGMDKNPEVDYYRNMWRDNYLGTLYQKKMLEEISVSDDEIRERYKRQYDTLFSAPDLKIIEILTDSIEIIDDVMNKLNAGESMRDLAAKYSKRQGTIINNGEILISSTSSFGEIGRIARQMEVGEIYGPLMTDEGYSIFELIDKKQPDTSAMRNFNEVKEDLEKQIKIEKLRDKFIDRTAELASKYNLTIDENLLGKVDVSNLSMVVFRYMGFGGRILAVPFVNQFFEWVEQWKKNELSLP